MVTSEHSRFAAATRAAKVIVSVAVVLVAIAWTGRNAWVGFGQFTRERTLPEATVKDWREYAAVGERIGSPTAPVVAVVFNDYRCSACAAVDRRLAEYAHANPSVFATVIRHLPLGAHANALPAARAAFCSARQQKFEAFHNVLLDRTDSIGLSPTWVRFAIVAGITDTSTFARCMESAASADAVKADVSAAERLGYSVVPLLMINGETYNGVPWDLDAILVRHARAVARN